MQKRDLARIFRETDDPRHPLNTRDKAILLPGFSGAFRRSEIAAFDVSDVSFTDEGMILRVRRPKTDQFGQGRNVGAGFTEG